MHNTYIGIDNGVTGSVGIIIPKPGFYHLIPMPVKTEQSYTKAKNNISRVDFTNLYSFLEEYDNNPIVLIERPMVNPGRFKATLSALRCLEAVLNCVEILELPHIYVDSKQWQKVMLPSGLEKEELKKASADIGQRLFPQIKLNSKLKDADALLMAEWGRRSDL
jgi:hypothetical protein